MRNSRKFLASALVAMSVAAVPVYAAMQGENGSCHGHGHHGHGGMSLGMGIFTPEVHDKLQLNANQESTWQDIQAREKTQFEQGRDNRDKVKQAFTEEMAKPEPDLARVATVKNEVRDSRQQAWSAIEKEQLDLYASFTPQQKGVVKQVLTERMQHRQGKGHHGNWRRDGEQQSSQQKI